MLFVWDRIPGLRVSHSGRAWGGCPPSYNFFWTPPPPPPPTSKMMPPMGHPPPLKNKATPSEKQPPPPINVKHSSMKWFLEKAQSIIIRNLAKILQKYVWRSSFLVHLHAYRLIAGNLTMKWTPSQLFFDSILNPNYAPPCIDLSPSPIKFWRAPPPLNTCEKSWGCVG